MPTSKKLKILVVDDETINLEIINEILSFESEHEVITTTSGAHCLELMKETHPDLVLLDIMMDGIDGLEVCRQIKSNPEFSDVYIILVSAKALPNETQEGYDVGANRYLTKPFAEKELLDLIDEQFG